MASRNWTWVTGVVAALALLSSACGSSDSASDKASDPVGEEIPIDSEELPIDTDANTGVDEPNTASACLPDEPECDDTVEVPESGQDLPTSDDEPEAASGGGEASTGMLVDGGLTVTEALATDSTGILAVTGYGFEDEDGVRLCESLVPGGERYECGGASVLVESLDLDVVGADVVIHDGLTYTSEQITIFGELTDGVLVLDATVSG